jgi:hypothetical protein
MPVSFSSASLCNAIILAGSLAGLLDGSAALLLFKARGAKNPLTLFQYIASAVYGKEALTGGGVMIALGILLHFFIAMSWVAIYFLVFPYIKWLDLYPFAGAMLYGLLVWVLMNLVIVRLSKAQPRPFSWPMVFINMAILILMIGVPTAYLSRSFYNC